MWHYHDEGHGSSFHEIPWGLIRAFPDLKLAKNNSSGNPMLHVLLIPLWFPSLRSVRGSVFSERWRDQWELQGGPQSLQDCARQIRGLWWREWQCIASGAGLRKSNTKHSLKSLKMLCGMLCLCIGLKVRLPDQSYDNFKKKLKFPNCIAFVAWLFLWPRIVNCLDRWLVNIALLGY